MPLALPDGRPRKIEMSKNSAAPFFLFHMKELIHMQTQSIRLRFKPIRIGWCVKHGDMAALKAALELSHTLWGGKYYPVIPVGNTELQAQLVRRFHVDILYPVSECEEVTAFIKQYTYLETPFELRGIFDGEDASHPNYLDIYHPGRHIHERFAGKEMPFTPRLFAWQDDDPLALALLASVGTTPRNRNNTYVSMNSYQSMKK